MPLERIPFLAVLVSAAWAASPAAASDPPEIGTARELPVVSVSLSVGSTDRDTKRVVYAPPPGWYVRSHRVVTTRKYGAVAYTVGTVPAGWNWVSDERVAASGKSAAAAAVSLPQAWVGGQVAGSQDSAVAGRQANTSSHHLLVVEVTARGAGLWQGGGGVDLTVFAEIVYLGN